MVATCNIYYLGQAETERPNEYGLDQLAEGYDGAKHTPVVGSVELHIWVRSRVDYTSLGVIDKNAYSMSCD